MDKFVIRTKKPSSSGVDSQNIDRIVGNSSEHENIDIVRYDVGRNNVRGEKRARTEDMNDGDIVSDPALRKPIGEYDVLVRDNVRREYVVKGPCQPISHDFPRTTVGKYSRCFQKDWFNQWEWLEYSVSQDSAFCFWCYLFRGEIGKRSRDEAFVKTGFSNWKKGPEKFREHVGATRSIHNDARTLFFAFKDQRQSLTRCVTSGVRVMGDAYRIRLTAIVDVIRFLLCQGLTFRRHDEHSDSANKGNFLELLEWYCLHNVEVGKVVTEAPLNHRLTSPTIQLDIAKACSSETIQIIINDLGDKFFSLLIDEARDSSIKEQMAIVVRYVTNHGVVVERFIGVVHVVDTTALSLKSAIDDFFAKHGLSISKLRGQGYDGASNMQGELGGLKTLILNENPYARFVHCFAHQLQLVIVVIARTNQPVSDFFEFLSMIMNMVGASCKRKDEFRQIQHDNLVKMLENGETSTGRGKNQECSLTRPGSTRWGSHHKTIIRLLYLWPSVIQVLDNIYVDGTDTQARGLADSLGEKMESYQFVFIAHLMENVLGYTSVLSQFLQQKDQNIIEAVSLVQTTKQKLQELRENGWDKLIEDVNTFCVKYNIDIPNMDDDAPGRRARRIGNVRTNYNHFRVDIFCQVLDQIGVEMENRFSESSTELLTCIACLDPKNSFSHFCESKLLRLAELYPHDFSKCDQIELKRQLQLWIVEMKRNESFSTLQHIDGVAKKMVELGIHKVFHLIYRLIELALVLPVATATVERAFSAMKIIKRELRNKMGDEFLNDSMVCYIERNLFRSIETEVIMQHFQNMKTRKTDLPRLP